MSPATQPGQFTWQDLVMLKFELPMRWHSGASYLMNQRTAALLLTTGNAMGRPLLQALPQGQTAFALGGSPIVIANQIPTYSPARRPIAFGNWQQAYTIADRKAVTMLIDPHSAEFCTIFKFEARIDGATTCPNAARLLRIR